MDGRRHLFLLYYSSRASARSLMSSQYTIQKRRSSYFLATDHMILLYPIFLVSVLSFEVVCISFILKPAFFMEGLYSSSIFTFPLKWKGRFTLAFSSSQLTIRSVPPGLR